MIRSNPEYAVVVAHPDDETLWCGGHLLYKRPRRLKIATLCRGGDEDRAPRFYRAAEAYGAVGMMADLEDGPAQEPLERLVVCEGVVSLIGNGAYEEVLTHSPRGEYTRHRRHEEVGDAVLWLWEQGALRIGRLRLFAYEDGGGLHLPRAIEQAHEQYALSAGVWREKHEIVTKVYGFKEESYEALTAARREAFWVFDSPEQARAWQSASDAAR